MDAISLEELVTPANVQVEVYLPYMMSDTEGNTYNTLPHSDSPVVLNKAELDSWLDDYEYWIDRYNNWLNLTAYKGSESEIALPARRRQSVKIYIQ